MTEQKPKFTPGPWKYVRVQPGIDTFAIRTMDDDTLAAVGVSPVGWKPGKDIANARLIAAAPEMYELLKLVHDGAFETLNEAGDAIIVISPDLIERINLLLAKARGEVVEK